MTGLLLAAHVAHGQDARETWFESAFYGTHCQLSPLPGTPSLALVRQAQQTNAALYGATGFANDTLLPGVARGAEASDDGSATAFVFRVDDLFGVGSVPTALSGCDGGPFANAPVDLMTSDLGIAHRWRRVGVFYAVSVNGYGVHASPTTRFTAPYLLAAVDTAYAFAAPFLPAGDDVGQRFTLTWDWIGGVSLAPGSLDLRLGYVGSRGLYTNLDEERSRLFVRSVVSAVPGAVGTVADLPYLAAGFDRLPGAQRLEERIGRTRLFGRRLEWWATAPGEDAARTGRLDLYTAHLEQQGLAAQRLDLKLVAGVAPEPFVHEASLGWHSPGYTTDHRDFAADFGFGVWGGLVWMPPAAAYGVRPGLHPTFTVDLGARLGDSSSGDRGYLHAGLRLNDTATLDVHPYAVDAVAVFAELTRFPGY